MSYQFKRKTFLPGAQFEPQCSALYASVLITSNVSPGNNSFLKSNKVSKGLIEHFNFTRKI